NHRAVLTGILESAGIPPDRHGDALVALDKLDKLGLDGVRAAYVQRGLAADSADRALDLLAGPSTADGSGDSDGANDAAAANARALGRIEAFVGGHEAARGGVATMRRVLELCAGTPAAGHVRVDASLARGLSYYTGCIMELAVPDLAGSLGGGGRYDNLVGMFGKEQVPAAGFSLGLERILVVMGERDMFPASLTTTPADV